jgi:hypothetical protein
MRVSVDAEILEIVETSCRGEFTSLQLCLD